MHLYIGKVYEMLTKSFKLRVLKLFSYISQKQPNFE